MIVYKRFIRPGFPPPNYAPSEVVRTLIINKDQPRVASSPAKQASIAKKA